MNLRQILLSVGLLVLVIGLAMLSALGLGIFCLHDSSEAIGGLAVSTSACLLCSLICISFSWLCNREATGASPLRDGFISVVLSWIAAVLFGALPFVLCGRFRPMDAIFETASGFSTTGASVIEAGMPLLEGRTLANGLESLPLSLLYWRSMLNWLGGIGFVMFVLMLLPALGGGKQLYNAEVPGLKSANDQLTPRIASTARLMLGCYVLWTVAVCLAYRYLGMGSFIEATCHAFATVATGGFSTHTESFGHFAASPALQWAATIAMFFSACNFMLMINLFMHASFGYHRDEEFRTFLTLAVACTLIFAWQLHRNGCLGAAYTTGEPLPDRLEPLLRTSAFQVVSMMSTTGFITSDYMAWNLPGLPTLVLFLMICGGCGGSTSGGLKMARLIVVVKQSLGEVRRRVFPHLMPNVTLNRARIEMPVVHQTMAFAIIYVATIVVGTVVLPYLSAMDFDTAFSATVSAVSNVGPGLGKVGPAYTYVWMSAPAKALLAFIMIAGRLELYTVFIVFMPSFWHAKR